MEVATSPRVDVLLKEELNRFRSELQSVRASFETAPQGRGTGGGSAVEDDLLRQHSFLSDSDLSSDGSDWEDCLLGHDEGTRLSKRVDAACAVFERQTLVDEWRESLHWQSAEASVSIRAIGHPGRDMYAPDEPPTRQRPRQSAGSANAPLALPTINRVGASEMLEIDNSQRTGSPNAANPNPNPNGGCLIRGGSSFHASEQASQLAQEELTREPTEQDEDFEEESHGTAREMALKIQQLLEVREEAVALFCKTSLSMRKLEHWSLLVGF